MKKLFSFFNQTVFKRFAVIALCAVLLFSVVVKPVNASAGFMDVAMQYQDIAQVAPYLVPIILVIIAFDWWYSNIDELTTMAEDIYYNGSATLREWAMTVGDYLYGQRDSTAQKIIEFPLTVGREIAQKTSSNEPDPEKKYILVPPDLLSLGSYGSQELLMDDTKGLLEDNNKLTQEGNGILSGIRYAIVNMAENVVSAIKALPDTLLTGMHNIKVELQEWVGAVNDTTQGFLRSIADWGSAINSGISKWGRDAVDWLKNINSNLGYHTNQLLGGIKSWFNGAVSIFNNSMSSANSAEDKLNNDTEEGKKKIPVIIGNAKNLINRYKDAFLLMGKILSTFIGISFVGDVLTFSLALGVFALVVNLASTLSRKDNSARKTTRKGG